MVDLTDVIGDNPLRNSIVKKKQKAQERIEKIRFKLSPLEAEEAMYDEMIAAIDKRSSVQLSFAVSAETPQVGTVTPSVFDTLDADEADALDRAPLPEKPADQ